MALSDGAPPLDTLVLRFADLGPATYGSIRVVGRPERTVSWVVEEPLLLTALAELDHALPEVRPGEALTDALQRTLAAGPFANPSDELVLAYRLGVLLLSDAAWQLLQEHAAAGRAVLFVSPTARLGRVPWGLLALPAVRPSAADAFTSARIASSAQRRATAAEIDWPTDDIERLTTGVRLMELVDVLMAVPANIANGRRASIEWEERLDRPALLVLDPRVPNQRPDSALGSVLGRPDPASPVGQHFARLIAEHPVRPTVTAVVELFRRTDAGRDWLAERLGELPSRLVFVGHATANDAARADQAALHLADERPLTAADLISLELPMPPRVALLACASGGDYRFDEATGLVAAIVLGGAELVTATLWSLPTTAGFRQFSGHGGDPMAEAIIAVDQSHCTAYAGRAVNAWQRSQLDRWRDGDLVASPVYWAALATFAVDGAR